MFEELPPRRAPRSQQFYISNFAFFFAFLAIMAAVTWAFLPRPLSIEDKFVLGGIAFTSLLSGVFLLNAKSVTPRDNQERLWYLFSATMFVPLICDVFGLLLR